VSAHVPLPILHEDGALLAVDKPAGLLSVAAAGQGGRNVLDRLERELEGRADALRVFPVHRLDRDTSGVLLFVKTRELQAYFREHWSETSKEYLAIVHGVPRQDEGTISAALAEGAERRVHLAPGASRAAPAVSHWRVLERAPRHALLCVHILTGRRHQIRVHLAAHGHPLVGDGEYGERRDGAVRLALHASALDLVHPWTGRPLRIESGLPPILARLWRELARA
jgi:RluA family pseudouridine synthase